METEVETLPSQNTKPKLQKTILDNFTKLTSDRQNIRVKSGTALIRYLFETKLNEQNELNYALKRLIRGLGSSRANARNGFFATLVALLNIHREITLKQVLQIVQNELQTSGSNSKSEKGEIYLGQVLVCGAIIKSGLYTRGSDEEKEKVIEMIVNAGCKRVYLSLAAVTFLNNVIEMLDENQLQKIVLPILIKELTKPLSTYTINNLYLLILIKKKQPSGKFLNNCIGSKELFTEDNIKAFCNILITPGIISLKHPVYEEFSKEIAISTNLNIFLNEIDQTLLKFQRNKHLLATIILKHITNHLADFSVIPQLLTHNYLKQTLNYFKTLKAKQQDIEFQQETHQFFNTLLDVLKKDVPGNVKFELLERLLFYPGSLIFEKTTKSKLVQQITLLLDIDGVKKLASVYRDVVLGERRQHESTDAWWNNDRLYAAQLLVKLLGHSAVLGDNVWRIEQLEFLMELSLIRKENGVKIGTELAASLKSTFFRALDHKLPKLEDLRQLLSKLFHHMDSLLTNDNLNTILRTPITMETYKIWQQTVNIVNKLEKKEQKKKKRVRAVFHTLFLQMGLQLFNDVKLATDSLQELFKCYEKINNKKTDTTIENIGEDPFWIEVIIDLFLNLLSQNLHLLRSIIACVFPHLCEYINATAMHQILSVLDPKNETNPLSNEEESDADEEVEEEEEEEESSSENEEDDDETVNDRLRMAVREALGANGYQTDEESIDIDDIDEEQGKKLDDALAQAFKQFKPNLGKKTKKQTKEDEALTHFRVRTLDLIEMYIDSEPSMLLCLEIMLTLLSLLEFCVRDDHQKPLQDRVRTCLKKLTGLKKFATTEDVNETVLEDLMKSLLEKGTKNGLIVQAMGDKIAECCMFVIRCSQLLQAVETTPKKVRKRLKKIFIDVLLEALERFFKNRDCLTPFALFHNVLQSNWEGSVSLVEKLVDFAFTDDVRLFRRNQALELLKLFYTNHRFLSSHKEEFDMKCIDLHRKISNNCVNLLSGSDLKINEKYISRLFNLLCVIKRCPLEQNSLDWQKIGESIQKYRTENTLSKDGKVAYKKLCNLLGIQTLIPNVKPVSNKTPVTTTTTATKIVKQEKQQIKRNNDDSKKIKKEAKLKRLEISSAGLSDNVTFTRSDLNKISKEENQDSGTGSFDENEEVGLKRKAVVDAGVRKKIKL